jgi:hypothetical protein
MQRLSPVTGQTLRHHAGTYQASIVWTLEDVRLELESPVVLATGTAAVDAATEATTGVAGPTTANARSIEVASTTGFVISTERAPVVYEIFSGDTGTREQFEVAAIDTDDFLIVDPPLSCTYPVGSTIRGLTHITAAIPDAVLFSAERLEGDWPMLVRWAYADGARFTEQVRLVRDPESDMFVTAIVRDVLRVFPDMGTRFEHYGRDVTSPIVRAVIRQIRADALGRGMKLEALLTGDQGHWLAVWRTLVHLANLGNLPGNVDATDWITYCKGEYDKRWNALTLGYDKAEVLATNAAGVASSSDGVTFRQRHPWDL